MRVFLIASLGMVLTSCGYSPMAGAPVASSPTQAPAQGWEVGSGGDSTSLRFVQVGYRILDILEEEPIPEISAERFRTALLSTEVTSKSKLILEEPGKPPREVEAICYENASPPRIEVSESAFGEIPVNSLEETTLVFHELLKIAGVADDRYQVSARIDSPRVFGRVLPVPTAVREDLVQRCTNFTQDASHGVVNLLPPFESLVITTLLPHGGQLERLAVCLDPAHFEVRLALNHARYLAPASRLWLFGLNVRQLPKRFFSQLKTTQSLWLSSFGDIRPQQYREIDEIPSLQNIYLQDQGYYGTYRSLDALEAGTRMLEHFHCTRGRPKTSGEEKEHFSGIGMVCARKPRFPNAFIP